MPIKRKTEAQFQREADDWNSKYPVGTGVIVTMDDGSEFATRTRGPAYVACCLTAVIFVDGIAGWYLLSRVRAVGEL
jgi:hypothetical protein